MRPMTGARRAPFNRRERKAVSQPLAPAGSGAAAGDEWQHSSQTEVPIERTDNEAAGANQVRNVADEQIIERIGASLTGTCQPYSKRTLDFRTHQPRGLKKMVNPGSHTAARPLVWTSDATRLAALGRSPCSEMLRVQYETADRLRVHSADG